MLGVYDFVEVIVCVELLVLWVLCFCFIDCFLVWFGLFGMVIE